MKEETKEVEEVKTFTKKDIVEINSIFKAIENIVDQYDAFNRKCHEDGNLSGLVLINNKFRYFVLKNKAVLKPEIKVLQKLEEKIAADNKIPEFGKENDELIKKFGKEDENGDTSIKKDAHEMKLYLKELKLLREKYKDDFAQYESALKKYNDEVLSEEIKVEFYAIDATILPEGIIPIRIIDELRDYKMIKD